MDSAGKVSPLADIFRIFKKFRDTYDENKQFWACFLGTVSDADGLQPWQASVN